VVKVLKVNSVFFLQKYLDKKKISIIMKLSRLHFWEIRLPVFV